MPVDPSHYHLHGARRGKRRAQACPGGHLRLHPQCLAGQRLGRDPDCLADPGKNSPAKD